MPFAIEGGYVVNKLTGEKKNKKPMSHARLVAYQRALYANSPDVRHKERYIGDSQGHLVRHGKHVEAPVHVQTKAVTDTLLGKHPEPHGPLRLRSMRGRYLGLVGKRRQLVKRLKSYNPSQKRDDHGRWAAVGSALHALGKVRLRPKVQAVGGLASSLVGTAHSISQIGRKRKFRLPSADSLLSVIEGAEDAILARRRARQRTFKAGFNPSQPRDQAGRWTTTGSFLGLGGPDKGMTAHVHQVARELDRMKRKPPYTRVVVRSSIQGGSINGYYNTRNGEIHIATNGQWPGMSTAHETGHSIDHKGLKQPWTSSSSEGRRWRAAVEQTPEVKQWRKWQKQGYIELNGNRYHVDQSVFRYYLSNQELWARSFAQWHATRSRNRVLKIELRRSQHQTLPLQWTSQNFGPVNTEITRLMRQNGYL